MKFKFIYTLLISSIVIAQQTCQKDTCNDEVTFQDITCTLNSESSDVIFELSWSQGKDLPSSYYQDFLIYKPLIDRYGEAIQNDFNLIDTITNTNIEGMSIKMDSTLLQTIPRSVYIYLVFPDRKEYIDCQHPGSSDDYILDLQFNLSETQDSLVLNEFSWNETFFPGPF